MPFIKNIEHSGIRYLKKARGQFIFEIFVFAYFELGGTSYYDIIKHKKINYLGIFKQKYPNVPSVFANYETFKNFLTNKNFNF